MIVFAFTASSSSCKRNLSNISGLVPLTLQMALHFSGAYRMNKLISIELHQTHYHNVNPEPLGLLLEFGALLGW